MSEQNKPSADPAKRLAEALGVVSEALSRLRYGAIQVTIHDGRVSQIDVTERRRLAD